MLDVWIAFDPFFPRTSAFGGAIAALGAVRRSASAESKSSATVGSFAWIPITTATLIPTKNESSLDFNDDVEEMMIAADIDEEKAA